MKRSHLLFLLTALLLVTAICVISCDKLKPKSPSEKFNPNLVLVYWSELSGQLDPSG